VRPDAGDSVNCSDFPTHAAAQAWFDTYFPFYGDVAKLDANHDGVACESLP
jgi:Excalibur calcium-binding domain